jgi:hypothetical protein
VKHALAAIALVGALVGALAATARAEPPRALTDASAAASAGDWPRVQQLLAPLAAPGPSALAPADRADVERLSGLAAYFQSQFPAAEAHFLAFLRIDPDGSLDPALYPPEALAFLEGVKTRHRAEIAAQRPPPRRYLVLNLVPIAAQIQNGEPTKGIVIGSVIGGLLVGQLTTYLVLRSWCAEGTSGAATCDSSGDHVHSAQELRSANLVLGAAAIATYVYSVYDGVTHYRARSRELALTPFVSATTERSGLLGIAGSF